MTKSISQKSANGEYHSFPMSGGEANHVLTIHAVASGVNATDGNFHSSLEGFILAGLDPMVDRAVDQHDEVGSIQLESLSGDPGLERLDPHEYMFLKGFIVPLNEDHLHTVDALAMVSGGRSRGDVLRVAAWAAVHDALSDSAMDEKWREFEASRQQAATNLRERIAAAAAPSHNQA